jgi:hypothetical protein
MPDISMVVPVTCVQRAPDPEVLVNSIAEVTPVIVSLIKLILAADNTGDVDAPAAAGTATIADCEKAAVAVAL